MIEPSPEFSVWIYSRATFDTEEQARRLVNYLLAHPRFAPDRFGEYEPYQKLTAERVEQVVALIVNRVGQELDPERVLSMVFLKRTRQPKCSYSVVWSKLPHIAFEIPGGWVEDSFVREPEHLKDWIEFIFGLFDLYEPWYARFALDAERHAKNFLSWRRLRPRSRNPDDGVQIDRAVGVELHKSIPGVYWGNYFGPFYVEWFGREKFETLPCVEKRWLDTGGIFLIEQRFAEQLGLKKGEIPAVVLDRTFHQKEVTGKLFSALPTNRSYELQDIWRAYVKVYGEDLNRGDWLEAIWPYFERLGVQR